MAMNYATPLSPAQPRPGLPNRTINPGGFPMNTGLPNRTINPMTTAQPRPGAFSGNAPMGLMQYVLSLMNPGAQAGFTPFNRFGGRNVGGASMGGGPTNFNFNTGPYQGKFTQQPNRLEATSWNMPNRQQGLMPFNNLMTQLMFQPQGFNQNMANFANQPRIANAQGPGGQTGSGNQIGSGTPTY